MNCPDLIKAFEDNSKKKAKTPVKSRKGKKMKTDEEQEEEEEQPSIDQENETSQIEEAPPILEPSKDEDQTSTKSRLRSTCMLLKSFEEIGLFLSI